MRVLKFLLAATLVWSLYWAAGAWGLRSGIVQWFAEQERQGWLAEYSGLENSGFPLQHRTRIQTPALADPGTGTAWSAEWISLNRPAVQPARISLHFPATEQRLSHFDKTAVLQAVDMHANLQLSPGSAMMLEQLSVKSGVWRLSQSMPHDLAPGEAKGQANRLVASSFAFEMASSGDAEHGYRISATAEEVTPMGRLHRLLNAAEDLPHSLTDIEITADIQFDTAWDRRALELRRPQPRRIVLRLAQAHWGTLALKASGALEIDEAGRMSGDVLIKAENWRGLLAMAERSGLLPARSRAGTERILDLLAGRHGRKEDLAITLVLTQGQMFLGPLPLGDAPRMILH